MTNVWSQHDTVSNDLRERVISKVRRGVMTQRHAAQILRCAPSTIGRWAKRAAQDGDPILPSTARTESPADRRERLRIEEMRRLEAAKLELRSREIQQEIARMKEEDAQREKAFLALPLEERERILAEDKARERRRFEAEVAAQKGGPPPRRVSCKDPAMDSRLRSMAIARNLHRWV